MAFERTLATAALALAVTCSLPANAETLQRLTVTQLTLGSDTKAPTIERRFHLVITAHVRERVSSLDNVDLPILAELELLGDSHSTQVVASGTSYREVITVVAHHTGSITIAPVTLDAIDARNGKAERFSSNALTLVVGGGSLEPTANLGDLFAALGRIVALVAGAVVVLLVVFLIFRRPRAQAQLVEEVTLPPAVPIVRPQQSEASILHDALTTLRVDRTRATAMRVRHVVRGLVGANDTETLEDVLRRPRASDRRMRDTLASLERAAFTYESDLQTAIARAVAALEGMVG